MSHFYYGKGRLKGLQKSENFKVTGRYTQSLFFV